MAYTRRIREAAIPMMLPPESKPLSKVSETLGIPLGTLKKWQQELRASGHAAPALLIVELGIEVYVWNRQWINKVGSAALN